MSVIDILLRVDTICKKYEKYDIEKQRDQNDFANDAFAHLYSTFDTQIDLALKKWEVASMETNRATVVALNAEVRRIKARLMDEVPKLKKLAHRKVKGLSKEDYEARMELVMALPERIEAIPEGSRGPETLGLGAPSSSNKHIKFDSAGKLDDEFFQQSEESSQFRQEYEMRKIKQDEGLQFIADGLDTLKNLAKDMNEELDRQVPLIDEIDTKVDKASSDLRNTNVKLKEKITSKLIFTHEVIDSVRSSRNFCIDMILICTLLGIAAYLLNVLNN